MIRVMGNFSSKTFSDVIRAKIIHACAQWKRTNMLPMLTLKFATWLSFNTAIFSWFWTSHNEAAYVCSKKITTFSKIITKLLLATRPAVHCLVNGYSYVYHLKYCRYFFCDFGVTIKEIYVLLVASPKTLRLF